jgi:hypothetical protein
MMRPTGGEDDHSPGRETGTRAMLGSVIGDGARPGERDETTLARRLLSLLGPGMLVLLDRGFDKNPFSGRPPLAVEWAIRSW